MDNLKNKIIDKIISLLNTYRQSYPQEINTITNDLINNKYDSLLEFVNTHFTTLETSNEIRDFVCKLVDANIIDISFKDKVLKKDIYTFIPFKEKDILFINSKPLNVKEKVLEKIIFNTPTPNIIQINQEYSEVKFQDHDTKYIEENISNNQTNITDLRKKILDAQLNYINDATNFIKDLETKDEIELYQSLIELNDIRFIQHSLSKLSNSTLNRLLPYVEDKLEKNKHSSIDMFIIDVIKKYLHTKML